MKIAIAKEGNFVSGHFGHCEGFEVFDVENKEIKESKFIENPGHRPGFLPVFLAEKGVNVIIAGGMGATAQDLFKENKIEVIVGVEGTLEDAINAYINGKLQSTGSVCTEHEHAGECEEH
ncbi:NifB/NifX family molybdenum-iron cluster-binding protein [Anaerophilus nitritogenes]|uniref:NifB/NifX family molybdenum-iron cluster-binding protein n=1 Tax=Anaerophilus nitritogenes TaxID=2498136 RepID=UPI00101C2332|nr:NifB/NifX family molybdenum-iron cluster-binding protein [Anaerophilus nitritogenes]